MRPEIRRYLDQYGGTYTTKALRERLVQAGHDPAEVDAALEEWQAEIAASGGRESTRSAFRWWTVLLHAGGLALVIGLLVLLVGNRVSAYIGIAAVILAVMLAIGWGISFLIGRALLSRTGLAVALIVPILSVLLIGGSCFALVIASAGPPVRDGTITVSLSGPIEFEGSAVARCQGEPGSGTMSIFANELGTLQAGTLRASVYVFPGDRSISFDVHPPTETGRFHSWYGTSPGDVTLDGTADAGTASFDALPYQATGEPGTEELEPLAGSITWDCG
jgi:hypothetical protein